MRVLAKDLCLHQVSAIDINLKIFVSEATKPKYNFSTRKNIINKFENN